MDRIFPFRQRSFSALLKITGALKTADKTRYSHFSIFQTRRGKCFKACMVEPEVNVPAVWSGTIWPFIIYEKDSGDEAGGREVAPAVRPTTSTIRKKIPFSRLSLFRKAVHRDSSTVKGRYLTGGYVSVLFFFYCILKASD